LEAEITTGGRRLYAREFEMASLNALGAIACLENDRPLARGHYKAALALDPDHARSRVGLALATGASRDMAAAREAVERLSRGPRVQETTLLQAMLLAAEQRPDTALELLNAYIQSAPPGPAGWIIPLEPLLSNVRALAGYRALAGQLASRAA
jgi:tetratricopeptide (TPR) repeat protein